MLGRLFGKMFGTDRMLLGDDLARRFIAVSVTLTCLGIYATSMGLSVVAWFCTDAVLIARLQESATSIGDLGKSMSSVVISIFVLYLAKHHNSKVRMIEFFPDAIATFNSGE